MSTPERAAAGWIAVYPEGHPQAGQQVTRPARCGRCGADFQQAALNVARLEAWVPESAKAQFARDVPGNWVPVFCPRCERRDLARGDVPARPQDEWIMRERTGRSAA